jgi:riboflavin biosynthesis pyrimidine reductase
MNSSSEHDKEILTEGLNANFVTDAEGRFVGNTGSSRDISSPEDRAKLIELRKRADAVVVGGNTARLENYQPTKRFVTYVATRQAAPSGLTRLHEGSDAELVSTIRSLTSKHQRIICEAGPTLLNLLLKAAVVDRLFVSIVGADKLSIHDAVTSISKVLDVGNYVIDELEAVDQTVFTRWRRA